MDNPLVKATRLAGSKRPVDWKNLHYLLIDDFQGMRQLLRESLRTLGATYVDQADSGGVAITMLEQTKYDVVMCDYNLGDGKNGQQVLEEVKLRDLVGPASVWLMVSAEKSVESVMGAAEHQPDGYLIKPITEGTLLTRLNLVWEKKQVFKKIDQSYRDKDYLKASKLCDELILTDKLHVMELLRMKAKLLLKSGEPEQARIVYEQVLAEREFVWAKTGLAKIRLQNGDTDGAKIMLEEVIAENRHYIDAYDSLAVAHQKLGELDEAAQVLERAAKLSPNSVQRQKNLGEVALKMGNVVVAEKAFRKSMALGEHSVLKTPDSYLGLARVCGLKNEPKEAMQLLSTVQQTFDNEEIKLRSKITEGMVYHESGDWRNARHSGDDLGELLSRTRERPDTGVCLEMARLLFAVGVKEAAADLLCGVIKNNHDNGPLAEEIQEIFEKGRMGDEGTDAIAASRKEAADLMNQGVLLWRSGQLAEAVEWMRDAKSQLPRNIRILFNCAHIMISYMEQNGLTADMAAEAKEVLMQADKIAPAQRRFAQLMEQLEALGSGES